MKKKQIVNTSITEILRYLPHAIFGITVALVCVSLYKIEGWLFGVILLVCSTAWAFIMCWRDTKIKGEAIDTALEAHDASQHRG